MLSGLESNSHLLSCTEEECHILTSSLHLQGSIHLVQVYFPKKNGVSPQGGNETNSALLVCMQDIWKNIIA